MQEVSIIEEDFDVGTEYAAMRAAAPGSGAIVFFVGLVRDFYQTRDAGEHVEHIELSHYPGMTEQVCAEIIAEARTRFSIEAARVVHRVGELQADQQIVFVAVASAHRKSAFDAAQYIMDYLKTRASLWKKEVGSRGEQWIGMKDSDAQATRRWKAD